MTEVVYLTRDLKAPIPSTLSEPFLNYDVRVEFAHLVAMAVPLPICGVLSGIRGKTAGNFALTSRPVRDFSANTEPIRLIIAADARARKCRPDKDGI